LQPVPATSVSVELFNRLRSPALVASLGLFCFVSIARRCIENVNRHVLVLSLWWKKKDPTSTTMLNGPLLTRGS
jgi:hypothetical protein